MSLFPANPRVMSGWPQRGGRRVIGVLLHCLVGENQQNPDPRLITYWRGKQGIKLPLAVRLWDSINTRLFTFSVFHNKTVHGPFSNWVARPGCNGHFVSDNEIFSCPLTTVFTSLAHSACHGDSMRHQTAHTPSPCLHAPPDCVISISRMTDYLEFMTLLHQSSQHFRLNYNVASLLVSSSATLGQTPSSNRSLFLSLTLKPCKT